MPHGNNSSRFSCKNMSPPKWVALLISVVIIFIQHSLLVRPQGGSEAPSTPHPAASAPVNAYVSNNLAPTQNKFSSEGNGIVGSVKKRVAIIGSGGYVGTRLYDHLISRSHDVVGYDRNPRIPDRKSIIKHKACYDIPTPELQSYDVVVYLGGFTGRKMCDRKPEQVQKENVENPVNVARRMKRSQTLIFASTSAVTEGSGNTPAREDTRIMENLLDIYSASMYSREKAMRELSITNAETPRLVALRFGTIIGTSPGQRVDMVHMALVKSAFTTGILTVTHGETMRAFVSLEDVIRAIHMVVEVSAEEPAKRFDVFQLKSFNGNIAAVANEVAKQTGARVKAMESNSTDSIGFSMSSAKFETAYNFKFEMSQQDVVADLVGHVPDSITAKGAHQGKPMQVGPHQHDDSMPCPVLDLHKQPLANDFRENIPDALSAPRHKLKLMRCKVCNHMYLSTAVDRKALFSDYLYRSATSATLKKYFQWLAQKVASEAPEGRRANGKVVEIASNDGTQLTEFKNIGWDTYGVDPAENLVPISQKEGHKARVGFWGKDEFDHLPDPEQLDAIVAQNVFAHVPNPIGQFDTAYHEHISFFTGHSFYKAAQLADLYITNFELTPIHGTSCLVTFMRTSAKRIVNVPSNGLQKRLSEEVTDGIDTDFFYTKYQARAKFTRQWIHNQLTGLTKSGYEIGAYGAAAKGMVLLSFLLEIPQRPWKLKFVLDDARLKQNRYCPGTDIPVIFFKNIAVICFKNILNIRRELAGKGIDHVIAILPFPTARIIRLDIDDPKSYNNILLGIPYYPAMWPRPSAAPKRRSVSLISHFSDSDDAFALKKWVRHHSHMFDSAVIVNIGSPNSANEYSMKRE
ncbi:hypothetical protein AAMO2058_001744200, partial [Amorphochlora amoebiformis]